MTALSRLCLLFALPCMAPASTLAFGLDGTCSIPYRNAPGFRIVDTVGQRWHDTGWGNSLRASYLYDACGLALENATYRWYPPTSIWRLGWRTMVVRRVCPTAGSPTVDDIVLQFDTAANAFDSSTWQYGGLVDTPANVVVLHNQVWDTTQLRFVNGTLVTEQRDSADRPLVTTTEKWVAAMSAYRDDTRDSSAYGAGGLSLRVHSVWDTLGLRWRPTERLTLAYQAGGSTTDSTLEPLDTAGLPTNLSRRWTFAYDSAGRRTQTTLSRWSGSAWYPSERLGFLSFDTHDNHTEITRSFYSVAADTWSTPNRTQYTITYDADQNLTELVSRNWNSQTQAWVNYERATYVYGPATAVTQPRVAASRAASPRLTAHRQRGGICVSFALPRAGAVTLEFFDAAGRLVARTLRDSHLAAGAHSVSLGSSAAGFAACAVRLRYDRSVSVTMVNTVR